MADLTLLVLAAGIGSRYGGLKQMDQVGPSGEAIIDYSIYDAIASGFTKVIFVIRRDIQDEFAGFFEKKWKHRIDIDYVFQELDMLPKGFSVPAGRVKPWGTAHAVLVANGRVNTPFIVINADDFYGRNAYAITAGYLKKAGEPVRSTDFSMVGFRLLNTLSEHGTVARGVCQTDQDGYLTGIREITSIGWYGNRIGYSGPGGQTVELTGEEPVSMNIWGFTPAVFPMLEREFRGFLDNNKENPKAEFYIPTLIQEMISRGEGRVKVLPNAGDWFGVTYREDKLVVTEKIGELVNQGIYPPNLYE